MLGLDPAGNPFKRVNRRSEVRKPRHVPSLEEMNQLLATEQGQDRVMLLLMLHTAARRGEVFRLKWDDVDLANSRIRLWTKKRQGGDMEFDWLPMTQELRAAMTAHKRTAQSVYVFCQEDGQPFAYRQAYMAHACARAGVKEFGFHSIRHLTACVLDEAGLSLAEIQAVLRHKSSTTTSRYLHALRGVQVGIEKAFGGKVIEMKKAPGSHSGG